MQRVGGRDDEYLAADGSRSTNPGINKRETKTRRHQRETHTEQSNEEKPALRNSTGRI